MKLIAQTRGGPKYGPQAACDPPTSLIQPAKYLAHFFQAQHFQKQTAVQ